MNLPEDMRLYLLFVIRVEDVVEVEPSVAEVFLKSIPYSYDLRVVRHCAHDQGSHFDFLLLDSGREEKDLRPSPGAFLNASPCRARAPRRHPLPVGEGHAYSVFISLRDAHSIC